MFQKSIHRAHSRQVQHSWTQPHVMVEESSDNPVDLKRKSEEENSPNPKKSRESQDKIQTGDAKLCVHEVGLPEGYEESQNGLDPQLYGTVAKPNYKGEMARSFPFELDPFQSLAVSCLERHESVLVAAHTSAGKTVVAEYATAMAFRDNQRVLYTSPLKALSNQKFRDFTELFSGSDGPDCVGLMTGDNTINPSANFIVMTTEILRSMLYRGSEVLREVVWVIFDEVHYMKDRERGVVWEETIILLPPEVRMVFLSATLPNAGEFADWISSLHSQPCHVIGTDFRPTPLQHYGYPVGGDGLYHLKDGDGEFLTGRFEEMVTQLRPAEIGEITPSKRIEELPDGRWKKQSPLWEGKGGKKEKEKEGKHLLEIIQVCERNDFLPCIAFCFKKREAESNALLLSKIDFNTPEEKEQVRFVFKCAMAGLSEEEQELPAIQYALPLLEKGIGTHHSGLLPIIKEVTEILFQESLIKVLCATETFAMGLNMPARTVIFTSVFKYDGVAQRQLTSGEYIQMSGRAGRRDIDDQGYVIMMINQELSEEDCKRMMSGEADPLRSSFRLTYYTLINLLRRVEGTQQSMGDIIQKSFQEFQHRRKLPGMQAQVEELEKTAEAINIEMSNEQVVQYKRREKEITRLHNCVMEDARKSHFLFPFLRPGRLVKIKEGWGWGVVVAVVAQWGGKGGKERQKFHLVDTLLCCERSNSTSPEEALKPGELDPARSTMQVLPVPLSALERISTLWISLPSDLRSESKRSGVLGGLCALRNAYPDGIPTVNVSEDMQLVNPEIKAMGKEIEQLESVQRQSPYHRTLQGNAQLSGASEKVKLLVEADRLRKEIKKSFYTDFCEEAKARTAVLRRLGHVNSDDVVVLKGKVACEIDTADNLLCAELLFDGMFDDLDVHSTIAMASVLLQMGEKSCEEIELTQKLAQPLSQLYKTAEMIADVSVECKQAIDREEYLRSFKTVLMDIMYAWSRGEKFKVVCEMTDLYEGFIARSARRLEELLNQLVKSAQVMGNEALAEKFQQGIKSIRRDIMFSASLYV